MRELGENAVRVTFHPAKGDYLSEKRPVEVDQRAN